MRYLAALLAGACYVLAFSPFDWWYLLAPCMVVLFLLWITGSAKQAFGVGFCFGIGQFAIGVSWVYVSIQTFGGMPPLLAGACVAVFVLILALFPAFAGLFQGLFRKWSFTARVGLIMPVMFVASEWVRGQVFTGFPWLNSGYPLLETPLSGLAPVGGMYLVGLIALFVIGASMALLRDFSMGSVMLGVLGLGISASAWYLDKHPWTQEQGDTIDVAIIQNNVPLLSKWNEAARQTIISDYLDTSALYRQSDLIVWPEAAIPAYLDDLPATFWQQLQQYEADVAFGALYKPEPGGGHFNSVAAVSEDAISVYSKQHLVPFGEYFPMKTLLAPVLQYLSIPMSNFSAWPDKQPPLPLAGTAAATSVCYEDAFPHEWRNQVKDAGMLLNVSEDMWFGDSLAPHQRLQMAQFRARETERPMVRSSNSGLSSLIDWRGRVQSLAPQFQRAVVTGSLQPRTGMTPFVRFGDYPAIGLAIIMLVGGMLFGYRRLR